MKELLGKSIRTALIFAAIGASVALAVPYIMTGLAAMGVVNAGALGTLVAANVVHTSLVFGLFGALDPVYRAASNLILGKEKSETENTVSVQADRMQHIGIDGPAVSYTAQIEQERAAQESMQKFR